MFELHSDYKPAGDQPQAIEGIKEEMINYRKEKTYGKREVYVIGLFNN